MNTHDGQTVGALWEQLVTVALLGTDRRDPPEIVGPIGDLVADAVRPSAAERMLAEVAAATAVRRGGLTPLAPTPALRPPRPDGRPVCRRAAVERWHHLVASWPVLEDEWTLTLIVHGWRADPEIVPAMLIRHRRDAARWTRAIVASGPIAEWLVEQLPHLDVAGGRAARSPTSIDAISLIDTLPSLPIPPELAELCVSPGGDVGDTLCAGLSAGTLGAAHRIVLVNLLARARPDGLVDIASRLDRIEPSMSCHALAASLADLARTRVAMLGELGPADPAAVPDR